MNVKYEDYIYNSACYVIVQILKMISYQIQRQMKTSKMPQTERKSET